MDRNEPEPGRQPHVSEHFECLTFIGQQTLWHAEQNADDAVLTTGPADCAVVAVDGDRARIGPLVVCHSAVLLLGVARTVSRGTDNQIPAAWHRQPAGVCRSGSLPSAHGPAQLR